MTGFVNFLDRDVTPTASDYEKGIEIGIWILTVLFLETFIGVLNSFAHLSGMIKLVLQLKKITGHF